MRLRCAARLPLRCHLHINGSPKQALLPLDFGTGNWRRVYIGSDETSEIFTFTFSA